MMITQLDNGVFSSSGHGHQNHTAHAHTHVRTLERSHACHGQIKLKGKRNTTFPIIYNAPNCMYASNIARQRPRHATYTPTSLDVH